MVFFSHIRIVILCVMLVVHPSRCQGTGNKPFKPSDHYHQEDWTYERGLPEGAVYQVLQTRDGYIWLATYTGLIRFDGVRFKMLQSSPDEVFAGKGVFSLMEDDEGTLWIGSVGLVVTFKNGKFTPRLSEGLEESRVRCIKEDSKKRIWIATDGAGIFCLGKDTVTRYHTGNGLSSNTTRHIHMDGEDNVWISSNMGLNVISNAISMDNIRVYTIKDGLTSNEVRHICETPDKKLWIATAKGLTRYENGTFSNFPLPGKYSGQEITVLLLEPQGPLWMGVVDSGVLIYDNGTFSEPLAGDELTQTLLYSIFKDKEGNIWFGSIASGLKMITPFKFNTITTKEGLSSNNIYCVYEDSKGNLWIGTHNGLNRWNNSEKRVFTRRDGLSGNTITAIFEDRDHNLWFGAWRAGLNRYDDKNNTFTHYSSREHGLTGDIVLAIHQDDSGDLWIGTSAGLNRFRENRFTTYTTADGMSDNYVQFITHDRDNNLWICTDTGGLNVFKNDKFQVFDTKKGLSHDRTFVIHIDDDGTLWVGTLKGLNRIKDGVITAYTRQDGLLNESISHLLEEDGKYLWLGCDIGIYRIAKKDLNDFADGKTDKIYSIAYNKKDGMKSSRCQGGCQPGAFKTRDGKLWFSTTMGVTVIDPANIEFNLQPPEVLIEDFTVDGEAIDINSTVNARKPLVLPPGKKRVEIRYTALRAANPEKCRFKFKLEGYDNAWVDAEYSRTTFYTGLPPGRYQFRVTACNNDGIWNETGAVLSFHLKPYFYQVAWFYIIMASILIVLVFTGYRLRIRQLKARERELSSQVEVRTRDLKERNLQLETARQKIQHKNELIESKNKQLEIQAEQVKELSEARSRFFANISHEFRTPLTLIMGPLEQILSGNPDKELTNHAHLMLRNSQRLLNLVNQLLELAKLDSGKMKLLAVQQDIVFFVKAVVMCFESLAKTEKIDLSFRSSEEKIQVYFDPDKLEKVLLNLLSNACKYTPPGESISVSLLKVNREPRFPAGCVEISVQDTGEGIPADQLPHIFERFFRTEGNNEHKRKGSGIGLALTRELVELHHGVIEVSSSCREGNDRGTEFTILLPLGKDHLDPQEISEPEESRQLPFAGKSPPQLPYELTHRHRVAVEETEAAAGVQEQPEPTGHAKKPCVLVVEDNPEVRLYIKSALCSDFQVKEARDGKEGIRRAKDLIPDLIVSDVMMPGADGFQLCSTLKKDILTSHIPIILLTARSGEASELEGLASGADDYLTKPFSQAVLTARSANLIQLRQQLQEKWKNRLALQPEELQVSPGDDRFYQTLEETIEERLSDPEMNVEELARQMNMSQPTLYRKVQGLTGKTPVQFIRAYRLKRAAQLLEAGESLVAEVAVKVGFSNQAYFAKCFKEQFQCLPSDIRGTIMMGEATTAVTDVQYGENQPGASLLQEETRSGAVILVVEDNDDARNYIKESLEPEYRVVEAVNGSEGIARALEIIPDLVVSDVMMPGTNGFQLCEMLKKDMRTSHIPIILLTARASEESRLQGLKTGADDYIVKPFNTLILKARLRNLIALRHQLHLRRHREMNLMPVKINESAIDKEFAADLEEVMRKYHSDADFTVEQLAEKLYMSGSSLYRKIRALSGESPTDYLRSYRLNRAARLLKKNYGTVTDVAFEVGFKNRANFTRSFKEKFHRLPSSYLAAQ